MPHLDSLYAPKTQQHHHKYWLPETQYVPLSHHKSAHLFLLLFQLLSTSFLNKSLIGEEQSITGWFPVCWIAFSNSRFKLLINLCTKSGVYFTEYAIDFGNDADGAAKLISEILSQVYGLKPIDEYSVFTNVGSEVEKSRKAFNAKYGPRLWPTVLGIIALIVCMIISIMDWLGLLYWTLM